eukprot:CAMPEP_0198198736 /NCGR_PEP_ID=MMETSP1445-20131203/2145_1 /TAXON_ID=36898 /ORGANISM="Pyramimonas sp., Strain CCMP2087" /LENGTH=219 /DNA_ID=CAMNT_0043868369 /DNA_START=142 /DNA_END=801 /DNA_ORIENTATION=-
MTLALDKQLDPLATKALHFSALRDGARELGLVALPRLHILDLAHHQHAVAHHAPEHHVLAVQPLRLRARQEKLTPVRVRPTVGHGEETWASVLGGEILVRKLGSIDGCAARAIALQEVPALDHKIFDDAMEQRVFVPHRDALFSKLARAKLPEVLTGLRAQIGKQLHLNTTCGYPTYCDVEENHRIIRVLRTKVPLYSLCRLVVSHYEKTTDGVYDRVR